MTDLTVPRSSSLFERGAVLLLFSVAGLALLRLLYEALFPRALWLGRPLPALLLALLAGLAGWGLWRLLQAWRAPARLAFAFAPLSLNLIYVLDTAVDPIRGRFLFAASLWLTGLFLARGLTKPSRWPWLGLFFVWLALLPVYWVTLPSVVGQADTFEFQVVVPNLGIAHPTGYPLYILLARLFAALPAGTMAWRVNLASTAFALLAVSLTYLTGRRLLGRELPPLLAAVFLGLTPTFWSQAIVAEVYALHALIVAAILWLLSVILQRARTADDVCIEPVTTRPLPLQWTQLVWLLAFVLGLGLTNHLTTLFLLPPALLTLFFAYGPCLRAQSWRANVRLLLLAMLAFLIPLLLYAYLPLRWQAVNGEPMGWARFIDWVIGGRFQGALQLRGWLTDPTRYEIVGRLLLADWGWFNVLVAAGGLLTLLVSNWRAASFLLVTWLGFIFYALNYYVPDLAVFIIPAHLVTALLWGAGLAGALTAMNRALRRGRFSNWHAQAQTVLLLFLILPALLRSAANWPDTTRVGQHALQTWGTAVLDLPLPPGSAILADSEKIAPLYYLQQAEGRRPDLDIMVLPDEAAYRTELDARLAAGQPVFLARFLPGLEGVYHLGSLGPLLAVRQEPVTTIGPHAVPLGLDFDGLRLLAYDLEEPAAADPRATAVTLFWQVQEPAASPRQVYTRWLDPRSGATDSASAGQHPAGGYYPTVAWRGDEIVPDYHELARPFNSAVHTLDLQVALGPPFAAAEDLVWQTVTTVAVQPAQAPPLAQPLRARIGRSLFTGVQFPVESRPQAPLEVLVSGYAHPQALPQFSLRPAQDVLEMPPLTQADPVAVDVPPPLLDSLVVDTAVPPGSYRLFSADPLAASFCGWMAPPTAGCDLGPHQISGAPLPAGATNFADKLALLAIDLPTTELMPGGTLPVTLQWQGLAPMSEDYTVFLQVLDSSDRLVGQVDAWPLQGTFPTSSWSPGELVRDPYEIQLAADLPPGDYRLQVGLYLLATLRRLPVLDESGRPVDDKVVVGGLTVSQ